MYGILPEPVVLERLDGRQTELVSLLFDLPDGSVDQELVRERFASLEDLRIAYEAASAPAPAVKVVLQKDRAFLRGDLAGYQAKEAYALEVDEEVRIGYLEPHGLLNALSTLKQLLARRDDLFVLPHVRAYDFPNVEVRSLSTTFAWYAGYSRAGFDSQLWDLAAWQQFIDTCADVKINQLNMCMYGYWPFRFAEFPETTLTDYPMRVWNPESRAWIEIAYTHPNIVSEFLPELIGYAHQRFIKIFAYIGLNSYNGGYSNIYPERRAVPPSDKHLNDFDSLCLSDPRNIDYLKQSMRRIAGLGLDGIVYEESEENYWYCNCARCQERYLSVASSPADAKHRANRELLQVLYPVIREVNPHCEIGIRMLREEPVEKAVAYLEEARDGLPPDTSLYWAPGPYCPESEFEKWVSVFGPQRICARDTEASGFSASMGRLFYMFRSNLLRPEDEHLYWSLENDIEQHAGSVRLGCRGINGYLFEYQGYFLLMFAAAQYGWNAALPPREFPRHALSAVFGDALGSTILDLYQRTKIVHEAQLPIFKLFFPFLRHKIQSGDITLLERVQRENDELLRLVGSVLTLLRADRDLRRYGVHFEKLQNSLRRNQVIFAMCLASVRHMEADDPAERRRILQELLELNEQDFALIRDMYFDVNPHDRTGIKVCGFPYHEIKRTIMNLLDPDHADNTTIYLGTETLGFMWL